MSKKTAPAATPAPAAAPANCRCGCGKPTVTERALFLSGHDARHAGVLGREWAAALQTADKTRLAKVQAEVERQSAKLQTKVASVRDTALRKAGEKAAREAARSAAKAAYDAALSA